MSITVIGCYFWLWWLSFVVPFISLARWNSFELKKKKFKTKANLWTRHKTNSLLYGCQLYTVLDLVFVCKKKKKLQHRYSTIVKWQCASSFTICGSNTIEKNSVRDRFWLRKCCVFFLPQKSRSLNISLIGQRILMEKNMDF